MTMGQVTKRLRNKDDGIYIAFDKYSGDILWVNDKLYASPKVASNKNKSSRIVKITKEMLEYLDREQNVEVNS